MNMNFEEALKSVKKIDYNSIDKAKEKLCNIAKPLNGLGLIEENFLKCCGIQKTSTPSFEKKCVVIMCADNGVTQQNIAQTSSNVTALVADEISKGNTVICKMASIAKSDVITVDIGIKKDIDKNSNVIVNKVAYGTNDISKTRAMTENNAIKAIEIGINLIGKLKSKGYSIIATGEMGIGNTTTSSACAAVLLSENVENVTGKGAGLSKEGFIHKINIIKQAIEINKPQKNNALDILSKLGGFDIAGMTGLFIGGAVFGVPVIIDGFVSSVSALIAYMLCPMCIEYMLASHCSKEPAAQMILKKLGLKPILYADMCLGEGSGAVATMPLYDMMSKIYYETPLFKDMNIEKYKNFDK